VPVIPKYTLEVQGAPMTSVGGAATDGKVTHMQLRRRERQLVGARQRPAAQVAIESLEFQQPRGSRPEVPRTRDLEADHRDLRRASPIVRGHKLRVPDRHPSVLKGDVIGGKKTAPAAGRRRPPRRPRRSTPRCGRRRRPTPSFMDLVREVRLARRQFTAYPGKADRRLRPFVAFDTGVASRPARR
jgi:hypothetical protein